MHDTADVPLTDTSRDELRARIEHARTRFIDLARRADPAARVPHSTWTVHQTVAHVLTVGHRYRALAQGGMYRRAADPRGVDIINQQEL